MLLYKAQLIHGKFPFDVLVLAMYSVRHENCVCAEVKTVDFSLVEGHWIYSNGVVYIEWSTYYHFSQSEAAVWRRDAMGSDWTIKWWLANQWRTQKSYWNDSIVLNAFRCTNRLHTGKKYWVVANSLIICLTYSNEVTLCHALLRWYAFQVQLLRHLSVAPLLWHEWEKRPLCALSHSRESMPSISGTAKVGGHVKRIQTKWAAFLSIRRAK